VKINLDIVNDVIYKYAKFNYKFFVLWATQKIRKYDFVDLKYTYSDLDVVFCVAQTT
jgi:hypothetical protein